MYWPIGTPRVYASTGSRATALLSLLPSDDGFLDADSTPSTPSIQFEGGESDAQTDKSRNGAPDSRPLSSEALVALKVSRNGSLFATISLTSLTIWQTKPTVVLAALRRSPSSLELYGENVDLLIRPDSAIFVLRTRLGYLITYSLATDAESSVYKAHFTTYSNVQRRRQSQVSGHGGQTGLAPDQFFWGPGEGPGVPDVSVRFRMVIKIDAGIECALALDDELVVATKQPAAIQCIRWTPDSSGNQTTTELLSRRGWIAKKVTVIQMTHDRPMNISTWITSDGRAYAVQRYPAHGDADAAETPGEPGSRRLFRGHCFHIPTRGHEAALYAIVNARFSLIAVGCVDGCIRVYSAKNYAGNIPPSHVHHLPVSSLEPNSLTSLSYSQDGHCLFAGFKNGWATWSVYGKLLSWSLHADHTLSVTNRELWLTGVTEAAWIGGGSEILMICPNSDSIWSLEMARSAMAGGCNPANPFRTLLQTSTSILLYGGSSLPDLTSISAEPFLWHSAAVPASYLLNQWPIRCSVISPDGRYVAVAGRRGLAHYSVHSGRWKTFASEQAENEFQVRGGMCWHQHILVAAVDANKSHELRLFSREAALDSTRALHVETMACPIVLIAASGEDSLLVYTYENTLHHFIFAPGPGSVRLIQVGQIGFHGIVRSPARVRGLIWLVPESHLLDGDPSGDVSIATVLFLVDGKLVMLRPTVGDDAILKYDMRVVAHNVEFHACMRDQPLSATVGQSEVGPAAGLGSALRASLWVFDGNELKVWPDVDNVPSVTPGEKSREPVSISLDFYPLSIPLSKGVAMGLESELVQRRHISFSQFRFSIRTQLILPDILRSFLSQDRKADATKLAQEYQELEYFPHALEVLLHRALDEEVDTVPSPESAILPRALSLLSSFKEYLDIIVQCTRKTEARQWKTLFAYLPPVQELFEESLQRGSLKTAGGYLLILHTLNEPGAGLEQTVRLLARAIKERDWDLCKELARFLAALDETGVILQDVMRQVNIEPSDGRSVESRPSGSTVSLHELVLNGGAGAGAWDECVK